MGFLKVFNPVNRTHGSYWSNSWLAKWLVKTFGDEQYLKPWAATWEEWRAWRELYSVNHPKLYWFTEEFLDLMQNIVYYPRNVYWNIRYYIKNRWIRKTHLVALKSVTPGDWVEFDDRFLEANFELLVNFVEHDSSVKELKWAATLTYDQDMGVPDTDPLYDKFTTQAVHAQKILELYYWWKNRPKEETFWEEWNTATKDMRFGEKQTPEQQALFNKAMAAERASYEEETKKLIELVSIREHLWT